MVVGSGGDAGGNGGGDDGLKDNYIVIVMISVIDQ